MSKKLTILVHPFNELGHINSNIVLAKILRSRGHKIVFVINKQLSGKLVKYGFEEEILNTTLGGNGVTNEHQGKDNIVKYNRLGIFKPISPLEKRKLYLKYSFIEKMANSLPSIDCELKAIVDKHNPDVILVDQYVSPPALVYSGKPWVFILITSPLMIENEMTPPFGSGYPTHSDSNDWIEFKRLNEQFFSSLKYNEYLKANGFPINANNRSFTESPFLNIYSFPEELDYTDVRPVPHNWFRVDGYIRSVDHEFELPLELREWEGKLIYLSLGSMGSENIELMKRLVTILSKSEHKYIVLKGIFGDKYELADNMWGEKTIPETNVLSLVDLVLTYGGTNVVTEAFYFGKPLIVLPFSGDQFDNAQRVEEKGFGVRLDPYLCSEEELLNSINMLLNDKELKERLLLASNRMQNSKSIEKVTEMIESLVS